MVQDTVQVAFVREVRQALAHLYDPTVLRHSALVQLFGLDAEKDPVASLRSILEDGIEALRPGADVPSDSNAWRVYHILHYRYVEQSPQNEVAKDLAVSVRQLRRQEKAALELLADRFWSGHDVEARPAALRLLCEPTGEDAPEKTHTPSWQQELAWVETSMPCEPTHLAELVQGVLRVVSPLLTELGVSINLDLPDALPDIRVPPGTVRQALVHIITMIAHRSPGGQVRLTAEALAGEAYVRIEVASTGDTRWPADPGDLDALQVAERLIEISGGYLDTNASPHQNNSLKADIVLPTVCQMGVLVIDDNADTRRLLERYLSNSAYRFVGASGAQDVFEIIDQACPAIIVLDVMLPGVDGWELLGRLREHPRTRNVPIVVCTILSQQQLAMTLGATDFLRKPITQEEFVSTLDRQIVSQLRRPRSTP
ncbi:MAG: response regulator [Anaerolineales bacterium]|nr:response regulator [Anaerolineales bacterium]